MGRRSKKVQIASLLAAFGRWRLTGLEGFSGRSGATARSSRGSWCSYHREPLTYVRRESDGERLLAAPPPEPPGVVARQRPMDVRSVPLLLGAVVVVAGSVGDRDANTADEAIGYSIRDVTPA
jgi:hypothetical protein